MATAQEILNTMEEVEEQNVIVIDSDLRTIRIPEGIKILGVESDDDVLRLHFKMPKMYGEFDLSTFALRVNYLNANGEGDVFVVQDAAANGDELEFSWLVGRTAAQYKGDVKFIVCAKKVKEGGIVEKEFNTTPATLPVLEGLKTTERVAQENPDVIEAILLRLDKLEKNGGGAEPDTTLTKSGKAADAKATGDALNELKEANAKQDERLTTLEQAGGIVTVEPADGDKPKVFISGVIPKTTDYVLAEMDYISKTMTFHAYIRIKCQGSSSLAYAKKNYTVEMFSDADRTIPLNVKFKAWGIASNKFVLKANFIDHSHARNVVCANLWSEIVASRADYNSLPEAMRNSPNNGAVDGFPIKVYTNGTYQGLYTWNIGKDAWLFGMDENNANHRLLSCSYNDNGTFREVAGNFRALWSGKNEEYWDIEVGEESTALTASLNALISCVKDTTDGEFKVQIGNYLDIQSALDYYLFMWAICGLDNLENNMLLATYDGVKWICGAYDLDSTLGLFVNGGSFVSAEYAQPEDYQGEYSLLWERIEKLFYAELKERYAVLRETILNYPHMTTRFERFMDSIGSDLYAEDLEVYPSIPSGSTNNITQIRNYIWDRLAYVDEQVDALEVPAEEIPCTGITLDQTTLTFTEAGTKTLTATVTPSDTTDAVIWSSDDSSIASVSGGVVTAVGNGSATITATCGAYSATCEVGVSGIEEEEQVDVLDPVFWLRGSDFTNEGSPTTMRDATNTCDISLNGFAYTAASGADGNGNISVGNNESMAIGSDIANTVSFAENGFTFVFKGRVTDINQSQKYLYENLVDSGMRGGLSVIYGYVSKTFELYHGKIAGLRAGTQIVVDDTDMHTIVYANDKNKTYAYFDGVEVVNKDAVVGNFEGANAITKITLGNSGSDNQGFVGDIRHMLLYERALSAEEIATVLAALN